MCTVLVYISYHQLNNIAHYARHIVRCVSVVFVSRRAPIVLPDIETSYANEIIIYCNRLFLLGDNWIE